MLNANITLTGATTDDLILALEEAQRWIQQGYLSGMNENETGSYEFEVEGEAEEIEEDEEEETDED